jgi:hypothetical protein
MAAISDAEASAVLDFFSYYMRARHLLVPRPFSAHAWTRYLFGKDTAVALACTRQRFKQIFKPQPGLIGVGFRLAGQPCVVGFPVAFGGPASGLVQDISALPEGPQTELAIALAPFNSQPGDNGGVQTTAAGGNASVYARWFAAHVAVHDESAQFMMTLRHLFKTAGTWPQVGRWWPRLYDEIAAVALNNRVWCKGTNVFSGTGLDKKITSLAEGPNASSFRMARRLADPVLAKGISLLIGPGARMMTEADVALTIAQRANPRVSDGNPALLAGAFSRSVCADMELAGWRQRRYQNGPAAPAF